MRWHDSTVSRLRGDAATSVDAPQYLSQNCRVLNLAGFHHVAIICSDYATSRRFYVEVLGLRILAETYRKDRDSYKLDLALPGGGQIELFSFPSPPPRVNRPEACGLRHLAFAVTELDAAVAALNSAGVVVEGVRVDEGAGKRFTVYNDPDGLPLELDES